MIHLNQAPIFVVVASLALLGASCEKMGDRINQAPIATYAEKMIQVSGAAVKIQKCEMFSGTRAGSCRLEGEPEALKAFVTAFAADEENIDPMFKQSCLDFSAFGNKRPDKKPGSSPKQGCKRYKPKTQLPPNQTNVHVRALYLAPKAQAVCIELYYPYG